MILADLLDKIDPDQKVIVQQSCHLLYEGPAAQCPTKICEFIVEEDSVKIQLDKILIFVRG